MNLKIKEHQCSRWRMASIQRLLDSFQPPTHLPPSSDASRRWPTWVLLDAQTYISGHLVNTTTAQAAMRDGRPIRVTFCVVSSPRVSYFCVHRPDLDSALFAQESDILAPEGRVTIGTRLASRD